MIQVSNLTKNFDSFTVLDALSMHVPKGSIYGLVGPNGAGKSTILRHITGIYKQDKGEILVDGEDIWENQNAKEKLFYIPDDIFYFGNYSTKDMKNYYRNIYKNFDCTLYERLKEVFTEINEKTPIRRLSKGMQKQSAFWLGLSTNPDLFILDEPVDGLDPVMRRQIWNLIISHVSEHNTTVLVSSHNLRELEDVCDHVGIMNKGKLLLERSLEDLQGSLCKVQIAFPGDFPAMPEELRILHSSSLGKIHTLIIQNPPEQIEALLKPMNPLLLELLPLSLEEIFIYELGGIGYECKEILL